MNYFNIKTRMIHNQSRKFHSNLNHIAFHFFSPCWLAWHPRHVHEFETFKTFNIDPDGDISSVNVPGEKIKPVPVE